MAEPPAIELTVRPPSAQDGASTSAGAGGPEPNLDPWLERMGAASHPWAGLRAARLRAARGRILKQDYAWAAIAPAVVLGIGVGTVYTLYRKAVSELPSFQARDCGAFDACFGRAERRITSVRHEQTNAFTGRSEAWNEHVRSGLEQLRPDVAEFPGHEAWPEQVVSAVTSAGGDWSRTCLAALEACLAGEPKRRASFNQQMEEQPGVLYHSAGMRSMTVLLVSVAAYAALLGVIALARWSKRVRRDWGDVSPSTPPAEDRGPTNPTGREAVSRVVDEIKAAEDERRRTTLLSTLSPPVRREALLQNQAVLARELLAHAEEQDLPALHRHVRAALLEARPHVPRSSQRQISELLDAHDLPRVSLDAWRQHKPQLAAEAVRGGWETVEEYARTFSPKFPALLELALQSGMITKSILERSEIALERLLAELGPQHPARYLLAACLADQAAEAFAQGERIPVALLRPEAFQRQDALAPELIRFLTRFTSMRALLEQLPMPSDPQLREAYARRLVGAWAVKPAKDAAMASGTPDRCAVCLADFAYPPLVELSLPGDAFLFCKHPPNSHDDCMKSWVETKVGQGVICTCPTCRQPMAPDELIRYGRGVESVDRYAQMIMKQQKLEAEFARWLEKRRVS